MESNAVHQVKPILIVLAGKTFSSISEVEGEFDDWIAQGLKDSIQPMRIDATNTDSYPDPSELAGVVVSGSHAMVSDQNPWSERLALWLTMCVEQHLPVLGICFGHQLLAHAFGGRVDYREAGIEIGTHTITVAATAANDLLFKDIPKSFPAQLVHSQSVLQLPENATLLAYSELEQHQAFRIGKCAWGCSFILSFLLRQCVCICGRYWILNSLAPKNGFNQ